MTKVKLPKLPPLALNDVSNGLIAVAVIYGLYMMQKAYSAGDKLANQATKPAGQLWSDVSAWAGGWEAVELTDLIIQPHYLDENFEISGEAWAVLTRDANYNKLMLKLFDNKILKPEYRHLVGQPIRGL